MRFTPIQPHITNQQQLANGLTEEMLLCPVFERCRIHNMWDYTANPDRSNQPSVLRQQYQQRSINPNVNILKWQGNGGLTPTTRPSEQTRVLRV